ncbi:oocyst capsule protein Cap380, putative [Hepatocystis sp. ex Piliocolobus tephrosceles]|nr:oocyst capsule protein Cap380, putative [Hepatocystis sp. ex Piliocolobus tephrosceles]
MLSGNLFFILLVCLFGIAYSSSFSDDYEKKNLSVKHKTKSLENKLGSFRIKRYNLESEFPSETCILNYKNVCNTSNYELEIKNGLSNTLVNVMLVQKERSDIVSVQTQQAWFETNGSAVIKFDNIPSLHYNVRIETANVIYNTGYTIGNDCDCEMCLDTKLKIELEHMGKGIIHTMKNDTAIGLVYPHNAFVHGEHLFNQFLLFQQKQKIGTVDDYNEFYRKYPELVYPCSGLIMAHAENYNIHYDLKNATCFYVSLMDKFLKKLIFNGYDIVNFENKHILLTFNNMDEGIEDLVVLSDESSISLPVTLTYNNGDFRASSEVEAKLIKINTKRILDQVKYIYRNNIYNRMEHVQLFRAFSKLFLNYYKISHKDLLEQTTGLVMEKPDSPEESENMMAYEMYAEELSVLLNSLDYEFDGKVLGLKNKVLLMSSEEYSSKAVNKDSYAYIHEDQLILKNTYVHCANQVASISEVLNDYIFKKLDEKNNKHCDNLVRRYIYANLLVMQNTFKLDCNVSYYYELYEKEDVKIEQLISNRALFSDVSIELYNYGKYEYTLFIDTKIDKSLIRHLKKYVPKFVNDDTMITIDMIGRRSDRAESSIDYKLKQISFLVDCGMNCTNAHPIVIKENVDYIYIDAICFENSGLRTICFPTYNYTHIFDMRLLRIHNFNVNPYPEIVLTKDVHKSITEKAYYVVLLDNKEPNFVYDATNYTDKVCKESISRCNKKLITIKLNNISNISYIEGLKEKIQVAFSTTFDEKYEEMFEVAYNFRNEGEENYTHELSYYNDSFYMKDEGNTIEPNRRMRVEFINIDSAQYDISVYKNKYDYTLTQTAKSNDIAVSSYNELSINYNHLKRNVFMRFLNDYIYFYQNKIENNEEANEISPHFTNVLPYNYDCLGVYAYLMNKFNILVNSNLNCDGLHMIVEVLLKGKLGKYFLKNKNKIVLNFFAAPTNTNAVFDLVDLEIYDPNNNSVLIKKLKLQVSIDDNNFNLLYLHKNKLYANKYFSNMYILFFKIAYLINDYEFDKFVYDVTGGIQIIDNVVLNKKDNFEDNDVAVIENIRSVLEKSFGISIEKDTVASVGLVNEIALLSAYIVELTSSYKAIGTKVITKGGNDENIVTKLPPLANIKYFVYVNESAYNNKDVTINDVQAALTELDTLVIIKKVLCCSNFVDVLSNSLEYYIGYKYITKSNKVLTDEEDRQKKKVTTTARNVINIWLNREISHKKDYDGIEEENVKKLATEIMNNSGYYSKKEKGSNPNAYPECIDLDMINKVFNPNGQAWCCCFITMDKDLINSKLEMIDTDKHLVYFLFRNLSVPFIGKTYREEALSNKRIILVKGRVYNESRNSSEIVYKSYLDSINHSALYMLEKVIFVTGTADKIIKEVNVEYQTFFVHPHEMIDEVVLKESTQIITDETYYDKNTTCLHYNNGVQSCDVDVYKDSDLTPVYVSYLENNQRKDIIFTNNDDVSNLVHNDAKVLSERYKIKLDGSKMSADVYNTVEAIVYEITSLMQIKEFGHGICSPLVLNDGRLHILDSDPSILISSIANETINCINNVAIYKKILENCNFSKEQLKLLFGGVESNILPFYLDEDFGNALKQDELLQLIYLFVTIPDEVLEKIKVITGRNATVAELIQGGGDEANDDANVLLKMENVYSIKINKKILKEEDNIYKFNVALYKELIRYVNKENVKVDTDFEDHVRDYLMSNNTCNSYYYKNNGNVLSMDFTLKYNRADFIYTFDSMSMKKKSNDQYAFNNLYIFEHKNDANEKFLKATLVLSDDKVPNINNIVYVALIAKSFDNKSQLALHCYPDKQYNKYIVFKAYNLEEGTIYFVCESIPVKYLKNGLYEFNKYYIKYYSYDDNDAFNGENIYENMPIRPIYEVKNDIVNVSGVKCKDVITNIKKSEVVNSFVNYLIHVGGSIKMHVNPYVAIKPIFKPEIFPDIIGDVYSSDDFVNSTYRRLLRLLEFKNLPFGKNIYNSKLVTLWKKEIDENASSVADYYLKVSNKVKLMAIEITDMYNNKILLLLDSNSGKVVCKDNDNEELGVEVGIITKIEQPTLVQEHNTSTQTTNLESGNEKEASLTFITYEDLQDVTVEDGKSKVSSVVE